MRLYAGGTETPGYGSGSIAAPLLKHLYRKTQPDTQKAAPFRFVRCRSHAAKNEIWFLQGAYIAEAGLRNPKPNRLT